MSCPAELGVGKTSQDKCRTLGEVARRRRLRIVPGCSRRLVQPLQPLPLANCKAVWTADVRVRDVIRRSFRTFSCDRAWILFSIFFWMAGDRVRNRPPGSSAVKSRTLIVLLVTRPHDQGEPNPQRLDGSIPTAGHHQHMLGHRVDRRLWTLTIHEMNRRASVIGQNAASKVERTVGQMLTDRQTGI